MNSFCISSKLIETRGGGEDLDLSSDGNVAFTRKIDTHNSVYLK